MKTRNEGCRIWRWNQTFSCSMIRTSLLPSFPPARKINFKSHPQLSIMWQRPMGRRPGTGGGGNVKFGSEHDLGSEGENCFSFITFNLKSLGQIRLLTGKQTQSFIQGFEKSRLNLENRFVKSRRPWTSIGGTSTQKKGPGPKARPRNTLGS